MLPSPAGQASALGWDTQDLVPLLSAWLGHSGPMSAQDQPLLGTLELGLFSPGLGQSGKGLEPGETINKVLYLWSCAEA